MSGQMTGDCNANRVLPIYSCPSAGLTEPDEGFSRGLNSFADRRGQSFLRFFATAIYTISYRCLRLSSLYKHSVPYDLLGQNYSIPSCSSPWSRYETGELMC